MVERARAAGVGLLLSVGLSVESSRQTLALARQHPGVLAAAGVHPRWLHEVEPRLALEAIEALARSAEVVALGEVGLEYAPELAPPPAQRAFLSACLELARRLDLAVSLHVVGAHADALHLLAEHGPVRAVVHYFVGDTALAGRYLQAGCFLSVGKPAMRPEHEPLRQAVAELPLDRLLLETDSYPLPGRTTEPRDVLQVCQAVAELRGQSAEAIAQATTANLQHLLGRRAARDAQGRCW